MIKTVLCSIGGFFHDEKSSLANKKDEFFTKMGPNIFFAKHFCFKSVISKIWEIFFDAYYLSVWQKLAILKIRLSTLISLINVESTLTDFEKFHPPQKENPPSTFIHFINIFHPPRLFQPPRLHYLEIITIFSPLFYNLQAVQWQFFKLKWSWFKKLG